jgi:putative transposase
MRGEFDLWQSRFWEHTIKDQEDFARYVDYFHYNPVKHGLVTQVKDWPFSTFHHFVKNDMLSEHWGSDINRSPDAAQRNPGKFAARRFCSNAQQHNYALD